MTGRHLTSFPAGMPWRTGRSAAIDRLTGSLEVDTRAFRTRFGWTPPCTLAQGLAAAVGAAAPL